MVRVCAFRLGAFSAFVPPACFEIDIYEKRPAGLASMTFPLRFSSAPRADVLSAPEHAKAKPLKL